MQDIAFLSKKAQRELDRWVATIPFLNKVKNHPFLLPLSLSMFAAYLN